MNENQATIEQLEEKIEQLEAKNWDLINREIERKDKKIARRDALIKLAYFLLAVVAVAALVISIRSANGPKQYDTYTYSYMPKVYAVRINAGTNLRADPFATIREKTSQSGTVGGAAGYAYKTQNPDNIICKTKDDVTVMCLVYTATSVEEGYNDLYNGPFIGIPVQALPEKLAKAAAKDVDGIVWVSEKYADKTALTEQQGAELGLNIGELSLEALDLN